LILLAVVLLLNALIALVKRWRERIEGNSNPASLNLQRLS
jgi:hypothetical protein